MTTTDAAEALGIKAKAVLGAIQDGRLSATKTAAGTWDVDPEDVRRYKQTRYRHAKSPSQQAQKGSGTRPGKSALEIAHAALGDCTRDQLYHAIKYGYCVLSDDDIRGKVRAMIDHQQSIKRAAW